MPSSSKQSRAVSSKPVGVHGDLAVAVAELGRRLDCVDAEPVLGDEPKPFPALGRRIGVGAVPAAGATAEIEDGL